MTLAEFIMRVSLVLFLDKQACGWRVRNGTNEQQVCTPALQSRGGAGGLNRQQISTDATSVQFSNREGGEEG